MGREEWWEVGTDWSSCVGSKLEHQLSLKQQWRQTMEVSKGRPGGHWSAAYCLRWAQVNGNSQQCTFPWWNLFKVHPGLGCQTWRSQRWKRTCWEDISRRGKLWKEKKEARWSTACCLRQAPSRWKDNHLLSSTHCVPKDQFLLWPPHLSVFSSVGVKVILMRHFQKLVTSNLLNNHHPCHRNISSVQESNIVMSEVLNKRLTPVSCNRVKIKRRGVASGESA